MDVSLFDYELPKELIAQRPVEPRDQARLLVLPRRGGEGRLLLHERFANIGRYLKAGDLLVFNRTRVMPARLIGRKADSGGKVECFLLSPAMAEADTGQWSCLVKPGRRLSPGTRLVFGEGELEGVIGERTQDGGRLVQFTGQGSFINTLQKLGQTPLPPYIREALADPERYQTVYGDTPGSAAAPTAGLHFTAQTIEGLCNMGVEITRVLLHIGLDTFRPVRTKQVEEHQMHAEYCEVPEETALAINRAREEGRRIIAVGTTALRTLETFGREGHLKSGACRTDLFLYPGKPLYVVDGLLTNFHLPRSTLLMLVSTVAGRERVLEAYREAIREGYRFFSFGDAMLIL